MDIIKLKMLGYWRQKKLLLFSSVMLAILPWLSNVQTLFIL